MRLRSGPGGGGGEWGRGGAEGASFQRSPDPLARFKGPRSVRYWVRELRRLPLPTRRFGEEGRGKEREEREKGAGRAKEEGREVGTGPPIG